MQINAFTDEMLKISQAGWPIQLGQKALGAGKGVIGKLGRTGGAIAIPATALASILGWEKAKQMKRRYNIGKLVEQQHRG